VPPDVPTAFPALTALTAPHVVSEAEFDELTKIPVQIVFGDNIPTTPQSDFRPRFAPGRAGGEQGSSQRRCGVMAAT